MKDTVLVFGSGRSGTSWLCETMARPKGYRLLFEPEHEDHVPEGRVLTDQLLIPGNSFPDADKFLHKLYRNRIDNDWIAQHSFRKYKVHLWPFLVKKKIVKFVRCNLGMHYISEKFDGHIVYIQRNPYSTLYSQNRVKFPWLYDLSRFRQQPELCGALMEFYHFDITDAKYTALQKLAIRWSIENIFPFRYFKSSPLMQRIIVLNYEELINNVERYENLLQQTGLQKPANLLELMQKPSSKTHPMSGILNSEGIDYKNLFSENDLEEIDGILKTFGYTEL